MKKAKGDKGLITANTIEIMASEFDAKLGKPQGHSFQRLIEMANELAEVERRAKQRFDDKLMDNKRGEGS